MPIDNKTRRRRLKLDLFIGTAILAAAVFTAWYLTSPQFHGWVRARIIAQLEQITGGRVELKSVTWNLANLEFDLRGLTIHGREAPDDIPYARAERLFVRARIISLLSRQVAMRELLLDHAVVHLIVYPDGSTNQPAPRAKRTTSPVEELFDLAINRVEIRNSILLLNDRPMPLDLSADDVGLTMAYVPTDRRYDSALRIGRIEVRYRNFRPFPANVETRIGLGRDYAQVQSLKIASGTSQLLASGNLRDFARPKLTLAYALALDLAQCGEISRRPELRRGLLTLTGQGLWNPSDFASSGKLAVRDLEYADPEVHVSGVSLNSDYAVTPQKLRFPRLLATLLGGSISGDAEVTNWTGTPARTAHAGNARRRSPAPEPAGMARLRIAGLDVSRLAAAVSTRSLPLDRVRLAGTATGAVDARWKGSPGKAAAELSLDFNAPSRPAPGQLPVSGTLRGVYDGAAGTLDLAELKMATRATQLTASGVVGRKGSLKLAMSTTDLGEWKPALAVFGGPKEPPVEVKGRVSFNGTVSGRLASPELAGHLQAADFDMLLYPAAPKPGAAGTPLEPNRRLHWDLLTADVEYSSAMFAAHRALLRHGSASVDFDASTRLRNSKFSDQMPFTLHAVVRNAELADALALAGYSYPLTGTLNLRLSASGTKANPQGSGAVVITGAKLYGEPVQRLSSDVVFANREAQLSNVLVAHNGASISGNAAYNLETTAFRFDLRGANVSLAKISQLQKSRSSIAGLLNFTAKGSGTKAAPAINANVQVRNLVLNGERLGGLDAQAVTSGDTLRLTARSSFQDAALSIDGSARLRDDYPANFAAHFRHLQIDPLLHLLIKGRLTGHSAIAGDVSAQGPLRTPSRLALTADLNQVSLDIENIKLHNEGPIRVTMSDGVAHLTQFRMAGNDTAFAASGTVELAGARLMNLNADGQLSLALLQGLDPSLVSYGQVALNVHVGGRVSRPYIDGRLEIRNGAISRIDLPNGLSDLNGQVVFNRDQAQVVGLTGKTGGGTLNITGYINYRQGMVFDLAAVGHDVRIRYPPGISSMADGNLRLTGDTQSALLSGDVTVTRFGVNPEFDLGTYLAQSRQPAAVSNPVLARLRMDVHVLSTPELHVQTSQSKLSGDVDLRLRGTADQPVVLGRVNIIEGDLSYFNTKYHIEHGDVTFTNPVHLEPNLNIDATTTVRDYEITLGFHGPLNHLTNTYRSDPPLPTADIVSLLAFGSTRQESAQQPQTGVPETNALLGAVLNQAVSSRVQKLFGVSQIKIDPQAGGTQNNPAGTTVTIEQQVANKLTITYINSVSRANYQTIQAEYNVNRNVSVVAVRDWNGVVSFDVRLRQRKR